MNSAITPAPIMTDNDNGNEDEDEDTDKYADEDDDEDEDRNLAVAIGDEDDEDDEDGAEVLPVVEGVFDFEVVGLHMKNNGRECCQHETCGEHLMKGDVIKVIQTMITNVDGVDEDALAVCRVMDGIIGCRVGFVPRVQAKMLHRRNELVVTPFAVVQELYATSTNLYLFNKSKRNYGMASCLFIDNINAYE